MPTDTSPGIARAVAALAARADRAMAKRDARYAMATFWLQKRDAFHAAAKENAQRDPFLAERARLLADHASLRAFAWTALAEHRHSDVARVALLAYRIGREL